MTSTPEHPTAVPRPASIPSPAISTVTSGASGRRRIPARRVFLKVLFLLMGIAIGVWVLPHFRRDGARAILSSELGTPLRPGPWGELYTVPFVIAAPAELLPVRAIEEGGTRWVFKNCTASQISNLLEAAGMPFEQRTALLSPPITKEKRIDLEMLPTPDMIDALPEKAREALYRKLIQFPENRSSFYFIHKETLATRFDDSGISSDTLALFRKFSIQHGDHLVFGALPAMLARIGDFEEKERFMRALTRQKTMLIRLRVTNKTDLHSLNDYWAKGAWAPNIRALLEGVNRVPGGTFTSIVPILPPLPSSQIYSYPIGQETREKGTKQIQDCFWTALNFFRDPTDTREANLLSLTQDYYPITGDPRYGDVLTLAAPSGEIVHAAVFIADNIVFTKNGSLATYPWMFSTIADLQTQYSFQSPPGEKLTLRYHRSKNL